MNPTILATATIQKTELVEAALPSSMFSIANTPFLRIPEEVFMLFGDGSEMMYGNGENMIWLV